MTAIRSYPGVAASATGRYAEVDRPVPNRLWQPQSGCGAGCLPGAGDTPQAPPMLWLGNHKHGWLDEGIPHWFEDKHGKQLVEVRRS